MTAKQQHLIGMAIAILAANLFSSKVLLVKLAFTDGASPLQVLWIRMATALPFFAGLFLHLMLTRGNPRPRVRDYGGMTLLGLVGYYMASLLDFHGMQYVTAGMERLLLYLYPTFIILIRSAVERTVPSRQEWLVLLLAYAGTALVYHDERQLAAPEAFRGVVLVIASALCFATYLYFSSDYIQKFGSRLFASYSTGISCIAIMVHALLVEPMLVREIGTPVLMTGLALGFFCTVLPAFAMHQAIAMIGSTRVGMLGTTGIFAPLVLGVLLFSEPLTVNRLTGTALVLGAVLILGRKRG